jgi:hypothetical protein
MPDLLAIVSKAVFEASASLRKWASCQFNTSMWGRLRPDAQRDSGLEGEHISHPQEGTHHLDLVQAERARP